VFPQIFDNRLLKYKEDISFLGGLFDVEIKIEPMPIQIDIRKTLFYKWGEKEGEKRGKQEGLKEGLKEGISGIIQVKFGSQKAKQIKNILDKINDINRLEKIKKEVIRAKSWEDFIKFLKNPNSKNKNSKGK
jgi:predicted transposase YdaD